MRRTGRKLPAKTAAPKSAASQRMGQLRPRHASRPLNLEEKSTRLEEVLDTAANIFFAKGFHGTSIEDVAREVGILKGSLYYYIKSKDDLLYQLLYRVIERADENISRHIDPQGAPEVQLRRALEAQIDYIIANQPRIGLFLHEFDMLSGKRQHKVVEVMARYNNRFVELVKRGQQQGKFVEGEPWLLVNGFLGMCNWMYRWYSHEDGMDAQTVKRVFVGMIMRGICKA